MVKVSSHLYPFEGRYAQVGAHKMHYLDEGSGPTVVMVHGNPSWSFYYRNLVQALQDRYRCIVPDHIGCGLSDKPNDKTYEYTLRQRIDDLERLLEKVSPTGPVLMIVHDWGGAIGMGWAVRHSERIAGLVVLNTGAFKNPKGDRLPWSLRLVRDTPLGAGLVRGLNAFSLGASYVAVKKSIPADVRQAYRAPYDSWANRIATLRFVQDIPLGPDDPAYETIEKIDRGLAQFAETPALVCWGEKDFVFDSSFLEEWERRLQCAEVLRFPKAGHYVLEDEGEAIADAVNVFLGRHYSVGL